MRLVKALGVSAALATVYGVVAPRVDAQGARTITVLAIRPNMVSGGNALVEINDGIGDIHDRFRDFTVRERLRKTNGRVDHQVLWVYPSGTPGLAAKVSGLAIDTMSQWLDALAKDTSSASAPDKVKRAKPVATVDGCWDADGIRIDEPATFDGPGRCNALYPNHKNPRLIAGAPLTDDVMKCQLKPIDPRDYKVSFAPDHLQRLRAVFTGGVCDYTKPGVSQRPLGGTYLQLPLSSAPTTTSAARVPQ